MPGTPVVKVKRIYDPPKKGDGVRILVDRLWPRGLAKDKARIHLWLRDIAPSDALRKWFVHDPNKWAAFQKKYREELSDKKELLRKIKELEKENGVVTLLYGARDEKHNQAVALGSLLKGIPPS